MTLIAILPLLLAVAGLLTYALASNAKIAEIGRLTFAVALLAFLLISGPTIIALRIR